MKKHPVIFRAWVSLPVALALGAAAASVPRETAFHVAANQLPGYFAGPWQLADEYALENLSGDTVAYTFIFSMPSRQEFQSPESGALAPTSFVARARERLRGSGRPATGNTAELYGEDRFASILVSADDTEPPVLRCYRGLPPHLVKEADALDLVTKKRGAGAWRVRRRLMLGLFDEAFCLGNAADTNAAEIVDMRTGAVLSKAEAETRGRAKKVAGQDRERVRMCREAWGAVRPAVHPGAVSPAGLPLKKRPADE